jgi:hypothetical protein
MTQGRQRQPFEILFTFSLNDILSIVAGHLSKKGTFGDLPANHTPTGEHKVGSTSNDPNQPQHFRALASSI